MSERISRTQAITRVMLATKLTRADAEEWLEDAIPVERPVFRDAVNRYAGGLTYVDLEADPKIAAVIQDDDVELESLDEALADLLGTAPRGSNSDPPKKAPVDRSFKKDDRALVEKMRPHVQGGLSQNGAALLFVDEAVGGGSAESKQRRLQRLYSKIYGVT